MKDLIKRAQNELTHSAERENLRSESKKKARKMIQSLMVLCFCLVACPADMQAEASRDSVPSNYGGWLNLTDGYTQDKGSDDQPKMHVEFSGDVIHLCWGELTKNEDGKYRIWYRRSTDLGKTWEDAKVIFEIYNNIYLNLNTGTLNKLMTVSGENVYIAIVDEDHSVESDSYGYRCCLRFRRSNDDGATFEDERIVSHTPNGWYGYRGSIIDSEGDMVSICVPYNRENKIFYFTSKDKGATFSGQTQDFPATRDGECLFDFRVSNDRWVSMVQTYGWYAGLLEGYLWMTTSDGSELSAKQIAPLHSDGLPYAVPFLMNGGNGDSFNFNPMMVVDGNTIHVIYGGNPGGKESSQDYNYMLYQKSTDFGQTWSNAFVLPDALNERATIAARGQNVYVYANNNGRYCIYYSNDNGATWNTQQGPFMDDNRYNPTRSFALTIDPYDESGKHAYMTGTRNFYMETHDGFKTVSRHFKLGTESFKDQYRSNNYALQVHPDKNGMEHWFMQYNHPTVVVSPGGGYHIDYGSQDIVYRRAEAEPAPGAQNMAYNLTDTLAPQHRVSIPMTESLNLKEAITVEFWIRNDNVNGGFQIASTTQDPSQEGSQYTGGWYVNQQSDEGCIFYEGGVCTEEGAVRVYKDFYSPGHNPLTVGKGEWCHVAFTYDSKRTENNARLYMNGQLAATNTTHGNILVGKNPISLGRKNGYYASEGLLDNFTIWSRALTDEEIAAHARTITLPQTTDADCRLLLTFDGTLKDQSQYGNDGVALLDVVLSENPGITPSGIQSVTSDRNPAADAVYSIDGRRIGTPVESLPRGIYIIGGKKHIAK